MIGDYYTKPLQGKKFEEFQNIIMGMSNVQRVVHYQHQCVGGAVKRENSRGKNKCGECGKTVS